MKMKNRSHRYDGNRTRPRCGNEYAKYKTRLSMMMVMYNKQHLGNIWNWRKKLSKAQAELKKCVAYKKSVYSKTIIKKLLDISLKEVINDSHDLDKVIFGFCSDELCEDEYFSVKSKSIEFSLYFHCFFNYYSEK